MQAALTEHLLATGDHREALATTVQALEDGPSAQGRVALQSRAAVAAAALGDLAAAATWFELVLEWSLQNGDTASLGYDYGNLAEIAYRQRDLVAAAHYQLAALRVAGQLDDRIAIAFSMILAGRIAHRRGAHSTFVLINATGEAVLGTVGTVLYADHRNVTDELLAEARSILGPSEVDAAHEVGVAMDLPAAIAMTEAVLAAVAAVAPVP